MKLPNRLLKLSPNALGRDFAVGDIHGQTNKLLAQLNSINFNKDTDRLICTGDLIDRGSESPEALALLKEDWFYSVLGNHEYMMVCALKYKISQQKMLWLQNGGEWIANSNPALWPEWFKAIEDLPLAIEAEGKNGNKYGIIHADFPGEYWSELDQFSEPQLQSCIWSRSTFKSGSSHSISGIDYLIHGHNVSDGEIQMGNRFYIEGGAYKGNNFILKELV
jgi:serine/threonine protein phosphatase 1